MSEYTLPSGVTPPKQRRSQQTMDRILDATAELLVQRGFSGIGVAEIAERAGVSVGSFYARFDDKDAVLRTLEERLRAGARSQVQAALGPEVWAGIGLEEFIRRFVQGFLAADRATEPLLRAFALHAQVDDQYRPGFLHGRDRVLALYRNAFVDRVVERAVAEGTSPRPTAARLAFDVMIALTEQRLFLPAPDVDPEEISRLLLAYLRPA